MSDLVSRVAARWLRATDPRNIAPGRPETSIHPTLTPRPKQTWPKAPKNPPEWERSLAPNGIYVVFKHRAKNVIIQDTGRSRPTRYQVLYKPPYRSILIDGQKRQQPNSSWLEVAEVPTWNAAYGIGMQTVNSMR